MKINYNKQMKLQTHIYSLLHPENDLPLLFYSN